MGGREAINGITRTPTQRGDGKIWPEEEEGKDRGAFSFFCLRAHRKKLSPYQAYYEGRWWLVAESGDIGLARRKFLESHLSSPAKAKKTS